MKAIVTEIQVGGMTLVSNLQEACRQYVNLMNLEECPRAKIHFSIRLPNGEMRSITIRDEDGETVAYGDFEGLPGFLDYAQEVEETIEQGHGPQKAGQNAERLEE